MIGDIGAAIRAGAAAAIGPQQAALAELVRRSDEARWLRAAKRAGAHYLANGGTPRPIGITPDEALIKAIFGTRDAK